LNEILIPGVRVIDPRFPASRGRIGSDDSEEKIRRLCHAALAEGWTHFKPKLGGDVAPASTSGTATATPRLPTARLRHPDQTRIPDPLRHPTAKPGLRPSTKFRSNA
jgi:hypothetical protein